ncbi:MAG: beta-galactosidase [Candidatus Kappaea frigidicola]|nr:beta-galactosidase [Candidatus Kappaea frigidicola]
MDFKLTSKAFKLNGNDFFILSGEVHYFRIPKRLWRKHLTLLKEASCNTVSTYIPWCWHEHDDNKFDFTGKTCPERNLIGFLDLCHEMGLYVIVKPGPYILAEYKRNGLPEWLFDNYPEVQAIDENSNIHPLKMTTYMNPVYLKYAKRWYDNILPIIRDYQITNNKMIIMMQLCNEIAFYYWFSAEGDYNSECLKYYHEFLENKYTNIKSLNRLYKTDYSAFKKVGPPKGNVKCKKDYFGYRDWHLFYRWYYAVYLTHLLKEVRSQGVDIPTFHNLPGWIDGRALEYPVNVIMYDELEKIAPEIMLGVDHIPETVDFRNLHDDLVCNEVARALQNHRHPTMGVEIQAGSRHHKTRVYANELDLFYKACLVHGLKGINFYMFSQGVNPPRKGDLGPVFYWQTPVDNNAEPSELYDTVQKFGEFIGTHGVKIANSSKKASIGVGLYRPYYHTEFTIPAFGKRKFNVEDLGMHYDPQRLRDSVLFDGLLRALQILNEDFMMEDLQSIDLKHLKKYKQLWVMSLDCMDKDTQKKLANYIKAGGHLVILPTFPQKDLDLKKCTYLEEFCKISNEKTVYPITPKIDLLGVKDFQCFPRINIYKASQAKTIAVTEAGECCGLSKKIEKGKVTILGTAFSYELGEHLEAYKKLINTDKIKKFVKVDNSNIIAGELFGKDCNYLYVMNYHRNYQSFNMQISNMVSPSLKKILKNKTFLIPSTYGFIAPLNMQLSPGLSITFTTSEVLSINKQKDFIELKITGHKEFDGGLLLKAQNKPKKILINGKKVNFRCNSKEIYLEYAHKQKPLSIKIY